MAYTKKTIYIIGSQDSGQRWTSNAPANYLYLFYTAFVDEETGEHSNRNSENDTYTFNNLTLRVTMPGNGSYYGYNIGAQIFSGNKALTQHTMLKNNSPQYWKQYEYNFGDVVVDGIPDDLVCVPITLKMTTNAPATTYWTNRVLTDETNKVIAEDLLGDGSGEAPPAYSGETYTYKEWGQYLDKVFYSGQYIEQSYSNVWDYNSFLNDPKYVTVTSGRTVEEERNISYTNNSVALGSSYFLPDSVSSGINKLGKSSVNFYVSCGSNYVSQYSNPLWKWTICIQDVSGDTVSSYPQGTVSGDTITIESSSNAPVFNISLFGIDPCKQYKASYSYGGMIHGEHREVSGEFYISKRLGAYVYIDDNLKWQWCDSYRIKNSDWEKCVCPSVWDGERWLKADNTITQVTQDE